MRNTLKRGTTPFFAVKLNGVEHDDVATVEFAFSHELTSEITPLFTKSFPDGGVTYDSIREAYIIRITDEETRLLSAKRMAYMDTRITDVNGYIPPTEIVNFNVNDTLFPPNGEVEDDDPS